jgi:hypothetical protein
MLLPPDGFAGFLLHTTDQDVNKARWLVVSSTNVCRVALEITREAVYTDARV